jgi:hypothetical protein
VPSTRFLAPWRRVQLQNFTVAADEHGNDQTLYALGKAIQRPEHTEIGNGGQSTEEHDR